MRTSTPIPISTKKVPTIIIIMLIIQILMITTTTILIVTTTILFSRSGSPIPRRSNHYSDLITSITNKSLQ